MISNIFKNIAGFAVVLLFAALLLSGCGISGGRTNDGYYTAEAVGFDGEGWCEFLTIYVSGNKIVSAEYNAKNISGVLKTWDNAYIREMNTASGTHPGKYSREYTSELVTRQDPDKITPVKGAEQYCEPFKALAKAALEKAAAGDRSIAFVDLYGE